MFPVKKAWSAGDIATEEMFHLEGCVAHARARVNRANNFHQHLVAGGSRACASEPLNNELQTQAVSNHTNLFMHVHASL